MRGKVPYRYHNELVLEHSTRPGGTVLYWGREVGGHVRHYVNILRDPFHPIRLEQLPMVQLVGAANDELRLANAPPVVDVLNTQMFGRDALANDPRWPRREAGPTFPCRRNAQAGVLKFVPRELDRSEEDRVAPHFERSLGVCDDIDLWNALWMNVSHARHL